MSHWNIKEIVRKHMLYALIPAMVVTSASPALSQMTVWADDISITQEAEDTGEVSIGSDTSGEDSISISQESSGSSSYESEQPSNSSSPSSYESSGSSGTGHSASSSKSVRSSSTSNSGNSDSSVSIKKEGETPAPVQEPDTHPELSSQSSAASNSAQKNQSAQNKTSGSASNSSGSKYSESQRQASRSGNTAESNRSIADAEKSVAQKAQEASKPVTTAMVTTSASRQAIVSYAQSFTGGSYVWGGDDPHTGADCSGFVRYVYNKFGVSLPRTAHEQALVGQRIAAKDAQPGDLIYYMNKSGYIHHVVMYAGNGKTIEAKGRAYGIGSWDVNYTQACWACRYVNDSTTTELKKAEGQNTATTAASLMETGRKAYQGDTASQKIITDVLGRIAQSEKNIYGFAPSVLVAQVIQESGWLSFQAKDDGGIQPEDNNVLGMNEDLLNSKWTSPWDGESAMRNVPQYVNGVTKNGYESMRTYDDIEECMYDYAAFKIGLHPELKGETNVDKVISVGLKGYATDPNYENSIKKIITKYNLTQFD